MATPPPMPPTDEDAAIRAAETIQNGYAAELATARAFPDPDAISNAIRVVKVYNTARRELERLRNDYESRRQARYDWLGQQIPFGHGIPDGVSPADRAVLMAAWNSALDRVRGASANSATNELVPGRPTGRAKMLAEAMRFGDDTTTRAVLTVSHDEGAWPLLEDWASGQGPDTRHNYDEWKQLTGYSGMEAMWLQLVFRPLPVPDEYRNVNHLISLHNDKVRAYNATQIGRNAAQQREMDLVDVDKL